MASVPDLREEARLQTAGQAAKDTENVSHGRVSKIGVFQVMQKL